MWMSTEQYRMSKNTAVTKLFPEKEDSEKEGLELCFLNAAVCSFLPIFVNYLKAINYANIHLSFEYFLTIYKARQQWTPSRVVSNLF